MHEPGDPLSITSDALEMLSLRLMLATAHSGPRRFAQRSGLSSNRRRGLRGRPRPGFPGGQRLGRLRSAGTGRPPATTFSSDACPARCLEPPNCLPQCRVAVRLESEAEFLAAVQSHAWRLVAAALNMSDEAGLHEVLDDIERERLLMDVISTVNGMAVAALVRQTGGRTAAVQEVGRQLRAALGTTGPWSSGGGICDRSSNAELTVDPGRRQEPEPIYGRGAKIYTAAGWAGVLPVPPGEKWPPPKGYTGHDGIWPTPDQIDAWATGRPDGESDPASYARHDRDRHRCLRF